MVRAARLDNRVAWWAEANRCQCWHLDAQRDVAFGVLASPSSKEACGNWSLFPEGGVRTDDPDEAQAAFDKGAEYVRTGVMP
ncbi:hypothetical protein LCGC14_2674750 [marine sediment metagenome]|uniref:Uncharacterized protein n=1 Tax=marine sediment metagenome TaxID=412755 RepID=A0A0F9AAK3_9ZZZZ